MQKKIGLAIVLILIVIFSIFAFKWIKHRIEYAITNAVFVESDYISNVGFHRVSGKVVELYKNEGDFVKEGEPLAKLYDKDFKIELESILDRIKALEYKRQALLKRIDRVKEELKINENVANLDLLSVQQKINEFKYNITQLDIQISQVEKDRNRLKRLLEKKLIPEKRYEDIDTHYRVLLEKRQLNHR